MSKYTTEVRYICEHYAGKDASEDYTSVSDIIANSRAKIFNFSYPIFDAEYKPVLETKILKHYYTREIGEETVGLWKLRLETRLNEIMPYYNKLYESELLEFDPLADVDLTKDKDRNTEGTNASNTVGDVDVVGNDKHTGTVADAHTGTITDVGSMSDDVLTTHNESEDHWDMYSDTPQGGLNGVQSNTYLTNARHNTDTLSGTLADTVEEQETQNTRTFNDTNTRTYNDNISKNTATDSEYNTTGNFTTTEDYLEHIRGLNGTRSYSKLLMEFRETFLNIDLLIIEELADLFMNIW